MSTNLIQFCKFFFNRDIHININMCAYRGMDTYLEPDILECEVKWALGIIVTNKASGGDGIPVELLM